MYENQEELSKQSDRDFHDPGTTRWFDYVNMRKICQERPLIPEKISRKLPPTTEKPMIRHHRWIAASAVLLMGICVVVYSQRPGGRPGRAAVIDEPFVGIVTSEGVQSDLFSIKSTGVSTAPVREAADAFLACLDDDQRKRTVFPVDDSEWRQWDNRHRSPRQGVGFDEMSEAQRKLAFEMIGQSLSAKGLKKTKDIMKLNGTLAELANNFNEYGEWLYWVTIMGKPSKTEPWGWQLDGHHLVTSCWATKS